MKWHIVAKAKAPFSFLVVPGRVSTAQLKSGKFNYHKPCSRIGISNLDVTCELGATITVVASQGVSFPGAISKDSKLGGRSKKRTQLNFTLKGNYNLADINKVAVHYYALKIDGKDTYCVVLEPTAGAEGYPGFTRVKNQWSIAVSPTTWKWFYLKNPLKAYQ